MNKESVGFLADLLKSEPGVIEKALDEGGFDSIIGTYKEGVEIFTPDELTRKLANTADDAIANLGKDGKLPQHIYSMAVGNKMESLEKKWGKEFEIASWEGIDNLLDKIVNKKVDESGKATDEKDKRIDELKSMIKDNDKNFAEEKEALSIGFDNEIINMDIKDSVSIIPIDGDDDEFLSNQRDILTTMFKANHKIERRDGKNIVFNKQGELLKDKVGDPLPLSDVVSTYAPKWVKVKSVPDGGRGGSSSEQGNK